jgi:hypothetical protein
MKKMMGFVSAALVGLALAAPAQAVDLRFGANVNYGTSNNFGLGPRIELGVEEFVPGLRLAADYHKFFDHNVYSDVDGLAVESSAWDLGFQVLYDVTTVAVAEGATIYAGGGITYAKRSYDHWLKASSPTDVFPDSELRNRYNKLLKLEDQYKDDSGIGVALIVGSTFNTGWTVIPYVEARYTIGTVDELLLAAGILFSTGGTAAR